MTGPLEVAKAWPKIVRLVRLDRHQNHAEASPATRPITARTREAVFMISSFRLQPELDQAAERASSSPPPSELQPMRCGDSECDQRSNSVRCFGYRAWRE